MQATVKEKKMIQTFFSADKTAAIGVTTISTGENLESIPNMAKTTELLQLMNNMRAGSVENVTKRRRQDQGVLAKGTFSGYC